MAIVRSTTFQPLLDAAIEVIDRGGEAAIRVRDIATACGVSTPILYRDFGSREGLIVAAQTERYVRSWNLFVDQFLPQIDACETVDQLRRLITTILEAAYDQGRHPARRVRASVLGSAIARPELTTAIAAALTPIVERTAEALGRAQQRGLVRADLDVLPAMWWYFGQIDGRVVIEQLQPPLDPAGWNTVSLQAVMATLFGDLR